MKTTSERVIGRTEFVAMIAMMFATIAFSVDSMLAAFPQIEAELGVPGKAYLMITFFMAGLAFGTLIAGPISDAIGRKNTLYAGGILYIASGLVAWQSHDYTVILAARVVQGFAASAPRVVSLAVVRDLYQGRQMAQIVSFAMILFTLVPTFAPAMGDLLQMAFGWRSILLSFVLFSVITILWVGLRLPESLPQAKRVPLSVSNIIASTTEVLQNPTVRLTIGVQCVAFALIFSLISMVQPIYDQSFGRAVYFAYWFGGIAAVSAFSTSLLNAFLVVRFGMRRLVTLAMAGQVFCAATALLVFRLAPQYAFPAFVFWQFMLIFLTGLSVGNLNSIALEPMGHIAGFTASVTGAVSTFAAAGIATLVGSRFDGTPIPLVVTCCLLAAIGLMLMWRMNILENRLGRNA